MRVPENPPAGQRAPGRADAVCRRRGLGFTDVALDQVGDARQAEFLDAAGKELLAKLHAVPRPADGPA